MTAKACVGVLVVCLMAASEALAQNYCELEKIRYRAEGDGVTADFLGGVDTSTCALGVVTSVFVYGSVGNVYMLDVCGGGPTSSGEVTESQPNEVSVVVIVYDRCLATSMRTILGTGAAEVLHVSANRKTASLRASFEGTDELNQSVSIAVDLVWNGVDHDERTSDHVTINEGIYSLIYKASGTIRDAVAAGSVTINGTDRTPLPSTRGTIEKNAWRSLEVYR